MEWKILPTKARRRHFKPEENQTAKKTEKEENKMILMKSGKKTEPEEDNNFNPAFSPHIQTAADTD